MKPEYFMYAGWVMTLIAFIVIIWRFTKFLPKTAPGAHDEQTKGIYRPTLTRSQKSARRRKTKAQKAARRRNRS